MSGRGTTTWSNTAVLHSPPPPSRSPRCQPTPPPYHPPPWDASRFSPQEKGQKAERFGRAVLGILLLQDIAVVPLLVLLPIIETQGVDASLTEQLMLVGATVAKGVGGLGAILVAGRFLLRPLFDVVAGVIKCVRKGGGGGRLAGRVMEGGGTVEKEVAANEVGRKASARRYFFVPVSWVASREVGPPTKMSVCGRRCE